MSKFKQCVKWAALATVFVFPFAAAADTEIVRLTIYVSGMLAEEPEEIIKIRRATVRVETTDYQDERQTNRIGRVKFRKVPAGTVSIIVTGQDTREHWRTGSCSLELDEDTVVHIRLDLETPTRNCVVPDADGDTAAQPAPDQQALPATAGSS